MSGNQCDECHGTFETSQLVRVAPLEYLCPNCRTIRAATEQLRGTYGGSRGGCASPMVLLFVSVVAGVYATLIFLL
jgi:hypothetical protein